MQSQNTNSENLHRLDTICRLSKIEEFFVHNNPEAEAQMSSAMAAWNYKTEREMRCLRATPLGFCLKVILNETSLNFKKTTSSVLSVIVN